MNERSDVERAQRAKQRHDLKTPLNAILGYTEMLIEEVPSEFVADLQRVRAAGSRLVDLINQAFLEEPTTPGPRATEGHASSAPPPADAPQGPDPIPVRSTGQVGRILVVDDVEENRQVLERHLTRQGHEVWLAANGLHALDRLDEVEVEMVLLDVMMPELDGYETLARIKGHPRHSEIPVLMISALDEVESVVRCIERGAEDYLPKPFNPVLLRARINTCLQKRRQRAKEVAYLAAVREVTEAAAAIEAGAFDQVGLDRIAPRTDELGALARVFEKMAREVRQRESRLMRQVEALRVEVDSVKKAQQVSEITETDYFRHLQERAEALRNRRSS